MTGQGPKDLVFTLFGEYLLDRADRVWVGSLIELLEPFDVGQGAVRTALSRMVTKGWLDAEREGRHAFYGLTPRGRRLLEEGQARIYRPSWDRPWDGRWLLLWYSIPEGSRHLRDRLRDRLAWLGFGSLGNGVWISPHDVAERIDEVTEQLGIAGHVECFRAERVADGPVDELVARCWDLAAVNEAYGAFIAEWSPVLERVRGDGAERAPDPRESYALRFSLIHRFRRFPLLDPYLPRSLLPPSWAGEDARTLFSELHDLLLGPADQHVARVLSEAPTREASTTFPP